MEPKPTLPISLSSYGTTLSKLLISNKLLNKFKKNMKNSMTIFKNFKLYQPNRLTEEK